MGSRMLCCSSTRLRWALPVGWGRIALPWKSAGSVRGVTPQPCITWGRWFLWGITHWGSPGEALFSAPAEEHRGAVPGHHRNSSVSSSTEAQPPREGKPMGGAPQHSLCGSQGVCVTGRGTFSALGNTCEISELGSGSRELQPRRAQTRCSLPDWKRLNNHVLPCASSLAFLLLIHFLCFVRSKWFQLCAASERLLVFHILLLSALPQEISPRDLL